MEYRRNSMEETIKRLLAEMTEKDPQNISWNSDTDILNDIGLDSLQLVQFLLKLEEEMDITIDYDQLTFEDLATIGTLSSFLSRFAK